MRRRCRGSPGVNDYKMVAKAGGFLLARVTHSRLPPSLYAGCPHPRTLSAPIPARRRFGLLGARGDPIAAEVTVLWR